MTAYQTPAATIKSRVMSDLNLARAIGDSARSGISALVATLPLAFLYCVVAGCVGAVLQMKAGGGWGALLALLAVLIAGSAWSAAMYRRLMPSMATGQMQGIRVLSVANALVYMLFGLIGFILMLALFLITLMLAVGSGYDMSADQTESVETSIELLRTSGAIWIWFAIIAAIVGILGWFAVRLLVFGAATMDVGAVRIFQTWGWTKGRLMTLGIASTVLIALPFLLVSAAQVPLASALGEPMGWAPWAVGFGVAEIEATPFGNTAAFWGISAALCAVPIALGHGLAVTIYNHVKNKA